MVARLSNVTSEVPLAWSNVVGTAWQYRHLFGSAMPSPRETCAWCWPTEREAGSVSPREPKGGAAMASGSACITSTRLLSPWQDEQVRLSASTRPFTCVAGLTLVSV